MTWVRIDDQLHAHPKVQAAMRASDASLGVYLLALSYASCYLTDGHVSEAFVAEKLPKPARRKGAVAALVDAGLWETNGDGWVIHDYLDYNPSRAQVLDKRSWDQKRKSLFSDKDLVAAIRARDGDHCRYCGSEVNWKDRKGRRGGSYDHVVPRGDNSLENLVVVCRECNTKKGGRTPEQAGMSLIPVDDE